MKTCGSHIKTFEVSGRRFVHEIFCSEDDRVELIELDKKKLERKTILIYSAKCEVWTPDGKMLFSVHASFDKPSTWVFRSAITGRDYEFQKFGHESLLECEVELSKMYIENPNQFWI